MIRNHANYYRKWAHYRKVLATIKAHLAQPGCAVIVATCTKATEYTAKHLDWFEAIPAGLYVRHGKASLNIASTVGLRLLDGQGHCIGRLSTGYWEERETA